jgi:hypothetical protein
VSLGFSLSTYFLIPARMPSLDQPEKLRLFWNDRVRVRRALLTCALIALGVAVFQATQALADARDAVAPEPAATLSGKLAPGTDAPSTLEVTASWSGLDPGELTILCVVGPGSDGEVLGGALGAASNDGTQILTLTTRVPAGVMGDVTMRSVRLAAAPRADATATAICTSGTPRRVGQPVHGSLAVD